MQADKFLREGKEKEAIEVMHYMIDKKAGIENACWRLADINIRNEDFESAKIYLEKMLEIFSGDIGMIKGRYDFVIKKLEEQKNK